MRIAFVSDIHGNLAALEAVIDDMARRQVDEVVNLGDTLSGPLLPLETARLLHPLPWLHVAGNHERQVLQLPPERQSASDAYTSGLLTGADRSWLAGHADPCDPRLHSGQVWPERLGPDVALCHGSPRSDIEYLLEPRWEKRPGWPHPTRSRSVLAAGFRRTSRCWPAGTPMCPGRCGWSAAC
jgi:hypothetical protein